ncbi:MAG: hypothetical protein B6D37_07445 [Sphingobacteriales bacterium UTBCD1]|nr:MAG: hypothetical protein B6D37_07445 [Sphingobacteriales bacterium UTBCD1]
MLFSFIIWPCKLSNWKQFSEFSNMVADFYCFWFCNRERGRHEKIFIFLFADIRIVCSAILRSYNLLR